MALNPIPTMVAAGGMAIPLGPIPMPSVPLPAMYYSQMPSADPGASGAQPETPQISQAQLQDELDSALQKSGLRTEIENDKSGLMILRFVQVDTGAVVLQFPTQTVLDIIASLTHSHDGGTPALTGHLYDRSA